MDALSQLVSFSFVAFSLAVFAITAGFRKMVEYFVKSIKFLTIWNDLVLPCLPVVIGVLGGAFIKNYPYPEGMTLLDSRVIFGLCAGLLSGLIYRVIKSGLKSKFGLTFDTIPGSNYGPSYPADPNCAPPFIPPQGRVIVNVEDKKNDDKVPVDHSALIDSTKPSVPEKHEPVVVAAPVVSAAPIAAPIEVQTTVKISAPVEVKPDTKPEPEPEVKSEPVVAIPAVTSVITEPVTQSAVLPVAERVAEVDTEIQKRLAETETVTPTASVVIPVVVPVVTPVETPVVTPVETPVVIPVVTSEVVTTTPVENK